MTTIQLFRRTFDIRRQSLQFYLGGTIILVLLFFAIFGRFFVDPYTFVTAPYAPPSLAHPMGTDILGRDILSRIIAGTSQSLLVAFISVGIAAVTGSLFGIFMGYIGGFVDRVANIIIDAWYSVPDIVLALIISVVLGRGVINTSIAIGFALVPQFFRVLRSNAFSAKSTTYFEAEKVIGARTPHIVLRHLLIATFPSLVVMITLSLARSILTLGGLGFLGLGIPPPTPEWGSDLGTSQTALITGIWWPTTFPGLMILIAVLGFNQFGRALATIFTSRTTSNAPSSR